MSSEGFHLVGLLRSLQGDIMALVGFFALLFVAFLIARRLIWEYGPSVANSTKALASTRRILGVLAILAIALFAWRVVTVVSVNRMPRSDVDKTGVYDQMDEVGRKK